MARKRTGNPVGRKAQGPYSGNSAQINGRVPEYLKGLLQNAAKANGHSFSQEMALRLDHSFTHLNFKEGEFGSRSNLAVCRLIGMMMRNHYAFEGEDMWDDPETHTELKDAVVTILDAFGPSGGIPEPSPNETRGQRRGRSRLTQLVENCELPERTLMDGVPIERSADEYALPEIWTGLGALVDKLEAKK
jgi:hypothetical protein